MRQCWWVLGVVVVAASVAMGQRVGGRNARVGPTRQPTTRSAAHGEVTPGQWVTVAPGVRAQAFLGFWKGDDARPGHAGKVVRILSDPGEEHFGIALNLDLPMGYTGELRYRETLTLPARPRTWDQLNKSLRDLTVKRVLSADGRAGTMSEKFTWEGGSRILPLDGGEAENLPTPFVFYDFDAGDPLGEWKMECWVNEKKVGTFTFKVVEAKEGEVEPVVVKDEELERVRPGALGDVVLPP